MNGGGDEYSVVKITAQQDSNANVVNFQQFGQSDTKFCNFQSRQMCTIELAQQVGNLGEYFEVDRNQVRFFKMYPEVTALII